MRAAILRRRRHIGAVFGDHTGPSWDIIRRSILAGLLGCGRLGPHARRVAEGGGADGHVMGDHTTRPYQRVVADGHARQYDRAAPDPDITPDMDRATKFQAGSPTSRVAWVIGRKDLNARPDLRLVSNGDLHHVEDDAVEVQEHAHTETNVEAVVAVKRRPDYSAVPDRGEAFQQQRAYLPFVPDIHKQPMGL